MRRHLHHVEEHLTSEEAPRLRDSTPPPKPSSRSTESVQDGEAVRSQTA